jgi:glycosyltransferase involved in cell wall biosynthesis
MRSLLMISHGYPPVGGSGMLRALKFSRYLPEHGWQPVVLTLRRTKHPRLDPALSAQVPAGTAVYRSPQWNLLDGLLALRARATRTADRGGQDQPGGKAVSAGEAISEPASALASGERRPDRAAAKPAGGGLLKDLLTTPDGYAGWYLPGLLIGLWAVLRRQPRVIFSTSPPATAHLIGRDLARLTGLPWVADFRDPWTLQLPAAQRAGRKGRWSARLEAGVLKRARLVVCNTDALAAGLREAYPYLPPDRFVVVTNGFDPADFPQAPGPPPPPTPENPFLFLHTGEFFPDRQARVPDPFLEVLRDLVAQGELDAGAARVRLVGSGEYTSMAPFAHLMDSPILRRMVEVVDFLPHDQIPAQLAASHCLLLFQNDPNFRMQVPAKTFEYLRAGRPILAVAARGATFDLVRSVAGGYALEPDDAEGLRRAILELVRSGGRGLVRSAQELEPFTRAALARRLAGLLDTVAGARRSLVRETAGQKGG